MKRMMFLLMAVMLFSLTKDQDRKTEVKDAHDKYANVEVQYNATTSLPEGTELGNGKIRIKKGYSASFADHNQVVIMVQASTNNIQLQKK